MSTISEQALTDPTLVDDLIALGLDPTTGEQAGTLSAFGFDYQISTADNPLNAQRGTQFAFHAEEAGRFLPGTYNYYSMAADLRHYRALSRRLVFANRVQLGNIEAAEDDPGQCSVQSQRYFLGGATSIRGWGRFEVSPLGGSVRRSAGTRCWPLAPSCGRRSRAVWAACCFSMEAMCGPTGPPSSSTTCVTQPASGCVTRHRLVRFASIGAIS